MTNDPTRDELDSIPGPEHAGEPEQDTEGHSIAAMLAMNELHRRGARPHDRKHADDDQLPPLTKRFPNMRDDKRG